VEVSGCCGNRPKWPVKRLEEKEEDANYSGELYIFFQMLVKYSTRPLNKGIHCLIIFIYLSQ